MCPSRTRRLSPDGKFTPDGHAGFSPSNDTADNVTRSMFIKKSHSSFSLPRRLLPLLRLQLRKASSRLLSAGARGKDSRTAQLTSTRSAKMMKIDGNADDTRKKHRICTNIRWSSFERQPSMMLTYNVVIENWEPKGNGRAAQRKGSGEGEERIK